MTVSPRRSLRIARIVPLVIASVVIPGFALQAQASSYPSLQVPTASIRDYTFAIAGGSGTSLLFQWREGVGQGMHLGLDAGFTDRRGSENLLAFVGGSIGSELMRARGDQPLDMLLTGGLGLAFGNGATLMRAPVGLSVGHTFDLEQGMALTPYVHPRLSLDLCSSCGRRGNSRTELSLNFDVGVNFRVNSQFALRAAVLFSGSDFFGNDGSFGVGAVWTPPALMR